MTLDEIEVFQSLPELEFNTYWIPCTWFVNLLKEAKKAKRIDDSEGIKLIMEVTDIYATENYDFRS